MSKYSDIVALLEWADKKKDAPKASITKNPTLKDYLKFQKDLVEFNEFLDYKKSKEKKEDKKDDKKDGFKWPLNMAQTSILLVATAPLVGLSYLWAFAKLLEFVQHLH